jgi:hypothetical protein
MHRSVTRSIQEIQENTKSTVGGARRGDTRNIHGSNIDFGNEAWTQKEIFNFSFGKLLRGLGEEEKGAEGGFISHRQQGRSHTRKLSSFEHNGFLAHIWNNEGNILIGV